MKILVVVSNYPYPGHRFSGIFNQRCVRVFREYCDLVEVLAPRPYVPSWLPVMSLVPRWKAYATIRRHEIDEGIHIQRPAYIQIPRVGSALWVGSGAFLFCRRTAREMHRRIGFDAIVSFDLVEAGGLAWRLGCDLGIPASCWAAGERIPLRTLKRLDLVFYQSRELFATAARVLGLASEQVPQEKHVILPRGIPEPPSLPRMETRKRVRSAWGVADDAVVVLSVGRITREKGIYELLEAISLAGARNPRIMWVIVGSKPAFDATNTVQRRLSHTPDLKERVRLLPACSPDEVWEYLCGADIFAFCSHSEGMPNALLEAMAMGLPAVAFAIPPVREIEAGSGSLVTVPPLDSELFAEAILRLAASPADWIRIGEKARRQIMERFMVRKNMAEALRHLNEVVMKRRLLRSKLKAKTPA